MHSPPHSLTWWKSLKMMKKSLSLMIRRRATKAHVLQQSLEKCDASNSKCPSSRIVSKSQILMFQRRESCEHKCRLKNCVTRANQPTPLSVCLHIFTISTTADWRCFESVQSFNILIAHFSLSFCFQSIFDFQRSRIAAGTSSSHRRR